MPQPSLRVHSRPAPLEAMPLTPLQHRLVLACALWLLVWMVAVLLGPQLLMLSGLSLNVHGHAHLHAHGHPFADARVWQGMPNAGDVLSNLPLLGLGVAGLLAGASAQGRARAASSRLVLSVFFGGLVLTGLFSATYHWSPNASGLVLDRLGMAVTFAGALALAASERLGLRPVRPLLLGVLLLGVLSAAMPLSHGNPLPWVVLQFGGLALLLWLSAQRPRAEAMGVRFSALLALYALAKLLEAGDAWIFHASGELVSGHSLKHLVAALAAWPVLHAMRQNARATAPSPSRRPRRSTIVGQ